MSKALATKNVAALLLGVAMVFGFAFVFAAPAKADTLSDLQAQVQALLAQISTLQGGSTTGACFTFTQNLSTGVTSAEVMQVQKFLNSKGFTVAATGAGSPGNETSYFGALTKAAVVKWQNANASTVLAPVGLTAGTGYWGPSSRAAANAQCTSTGGTTGTGGTTTPTGPGITVTAGTQPINSLAPQLANRVPFTTFTLTNNTGAAVTISGVTVQRTGLAADVVFAGVELVDSNGLQIGTSRTFDSNHQAIIGTPWTLNPGQSATYTVAGNMNSNEANYAGQVAAISVVGINTTVPVTGSLPITGAYQTINASLTIGTATAYISSFDPQGYRSEPIGTTGITFSGIRVTAGSAEDQKLYSITWNQVGSVGSTDIGNLSTVVNGTSYPVTVDSTGKYYSSTFPGGVLVPKGNTIDVYIKGDLVGSNSSGRTIEFDIYRQSDVYLVGQTYGYGITPTPTVTNTVLSGNHASEFVGTGGGSTAGTVGTPFFQGSLTNVTAGTLSTVGNAGSVGAQNIAINVPNQPLGGFSTNFTGEPVTVQSMTFTVTHSTNGIGTTTSVSLVDGNGNVVAGPVDETTTNNGGGAGQLVFNSSVTFPVGAQTYTLKGTVASNAVNGQTITLGTTPSSQWTGAQGQTSGSSVTINAGQFNMSPMTIEGPSLIISAGSSPASTLVAVGAQNFTFATINLDASQSGEDIRLSSLPIWVVTQSTDATDLSNCQLWNGTTALNSNQVVNSSSWSSNEANFVFNNTLTIPKGTVVALTLQCNLASSPAGTSWAAGVKDATPWPSPTGFGSGITLTSVTNSGNGDLIVQPTGGSSVGTSGTMSKGSVSLAATTPTALSSAQVAGGTVGVTVGTFTLQPTSDSVNLQSIGLSLNSNMASSSDVTRAYIYNGSTQVGSVIFTGSPIAGAGTSNYYYATTSVASLNLPQNVQTTLTIKADIASIGAGQSAMDGHKVVINLNDARGTGASSGSQVDSGVGAASQTGVNIYRTFPTVAAAGVSSGTLLGGTQTLTQFTVTANAAGPVGLDQLGINIATSTASVANGTTSVSSVNVYAYTDAGYSVAAPGTSSGLVGTIANPATSGNNIVTFSGNGTPVEIPAGSTYYFKVTGTVTQVAGSSATHGTVQTYLAGDNTNLAPVMKTVAQETTATANFVWSPNSTTTQPVSAVDWSNGYGVTGLPSSGITPVTTLSN